MTKKLTLVAIFAHPDDEAFGTGGTLTKYAQELQEEFNPLENDWFWQETFILAQHQGEKLNRPIVKHKECDLFAGVR